MRQVFAPFTDDQVQSMNEYQASGALHEFTCGADSSHPVLVADPGGWTCRSCGWTMNWAHEFMVNWAWREMILDAYS